MTNVMQQTIQYIAKGWKIRKRKNITRTVIYIR